MEKINQEGDYVPWPDGGLGRTWLVLKPMKLTHLVKICGIRQANRTTSMMRLVLFDL
jgi:hypothetical protein